MLGALGFYVAFVVIMLL